MSRWFCATPSVKKKRRKAGEKRQVTWGANDSKKSEGKQGGGWGGTRTAFRELGHGDRKGTKTPVGRVKKSRKRNKKKTNQAGKSSPENRASNGVYGTEKAEQTPSKQSLGVSAQVSMTFLSQRNETPKKENNCLVKGDSTGEWDSVMG